MFAEPDGGDETFGIDEKPERCSKGTILARDETEGIEQQGIVRMGLLAKGENFSRSRMIRIDGEHDDLRPTFQHGIDVLHRRLAPRAIGREEIEQYRSAPKGAQLKNLAISRYSPEIRRDCPGSARSGQVGIRRPNQKGNSHADGGKRQPDSSPGGFPFRPKRITCNAVIESQCAFPYSAVVKG
jgi:hypothetical protein